MMGLPSSSYILDESDPDIVILRRQNGCFIAAFSARGATKEGIREAAMEDYRILFDAHAISLALLTEKAQSEYSTPEVDIYRSV